MLWGSLCSQSTRKYELSCLFVFLITGGKPLTSREFSHIGEMWSLVPPSVNMMALTATVTIATCQKIVRALCMKRCYLVTTNPPKRKCHWSRDGFTRRIYTNCGRANHEKEGGTSYHHILSYVQWLPFCSPVQVFAEWKAILSFRCTASFQVSTNFVHSTAKEIKCWITACAKQSINSYCCTVERLMSVVASSPSSSTGKCT